MLSRIFASPSKAVGARSLLWSQLTSGLEASSVLASVILHGASTCRMHRGHQAHASLCQQRPLHISHALVREPHPTQPASTRAPIKEGGFTSALVCYHSPFAAKLSIMRDVGGGGGGQELMSRNTSLRAYGAIKQPEQPADLEQPVLWSPAKELAEARERMTWHELMSRRNIESSEVLQVRPRLAATCISAITRVLFNVDYKEEQTSASTEGNVWTKDMIRFRVCDVVCHQVLHPVQ